MAWGAVAKCEEQQKEEGDKGMFATITKKIRSNWFLFEELVKRDFKQKYKRTVLGMAWSVLSPLLTLLVMSLVFTRFFGRTVEHYTIYMFCGNLVFSYFRESTSNGMRSLMSNASIFTKINLPKYIFLFSKNVSSLINFGLTLCIFFLFALVDGIHFGPHFFALLYPIICLMFFNIGVGLVLSAMYVFFRDTSYLYDVFTMLLMYLSAIFYTVDSYPAHIQKMFMLNPVYSYIRYFRIVVLEGRLPSVEHHLICIFYSLVAMGVGSFIYKKYNHQFLYYV